MRSNIVFYILRFVFPCKYEKHNCFYFLFIRLLEFIVKRKKTERQIESGRDENRERNTGSVHKEISRWKETSRRINRNRGADCTYRYNYDYLLQNTFFFFPYCVLLSFIASLSLPLILASKSMYFINWICWCVILFISSQAYFRAKLKFLVSPF